MNNYETIIDTKLIEDGSIFIKELVLKRQNYKYSYPLDTRGTLSITERTIGDIKRYAASKLSNELLKHLTVSSEDIMSNRKIYTFGISIMLEPEKLQLTKLIDRQSDTINDKLDSISKLSQDLEQERAKPFLTICYERFFLRQ